MQNNNRLEIGMKVIELLQNGVTDSEGNIREFDIVDYYNITRLSPSTLYDSLYTNFWHMFDMDSLKLFHSFVIRSQNDSKNTVKGIMEVKHFIPVDGGMREITDDEKKGVIGYLKFNKIPLTANTYAIVLKRYLNGEIILNYNAEEKNKKLVKSY